MWLRIGPSGRIYVAQDKSKWWNLCGSGYVQVVEFMWFRIGPSGGFYVTQDRPKWWNIVNKVMKIRLPENMGTFQLAGKLLASQEGIRSVPL
jgi:hypothetical protein